jgi:putative membrane protein
VTAAYEYLAAAVGPVAAALAAVLAVAALLAVGFYLAAASHLRRRGDAWPWARDASFALGGVGVAAAVTVPLPAAPFTADMAQYVMAGMVAPLLLVLARPLTLALRVLRPGWVRRVLLTVAHSRYAAVVAFPLTAVLLDVGGLWLVYRTPLFAAIHHQDWLLAVVKVHTLAAGILLAFVVCELDPLRRRWSLQWRVGVLLAVGTTHAALAKMLYVTPPPGTAFTRSDLRTGALLMYYGGDLVVLALAVTLAVQWYAATGRAQAAARRRTATSPSGTAP